MLSIDVVKIRMQFNPQRYHSVIAAFPQIIHQEGVVGLYKGVLPSTLRGAFIAAGVYQLSFFTYIQ